MVGIMRKKILKIIITPIALILLLFVVYMALLIITDYRAKPVEEVSVSSNHKDKTLQENESYSIMTWNIGYGALGKDADFFMDGGESVISSDKETIKNNLSEISMIIEAEDTDFLFLQEVDKLSKRSHFINELDYFSDEIKGYSTAYGVNYRCLYVPYPWPTLGHVDSGIVTMSKYSVAEVNRIALPSTFTFPMSMCNLKRCLLVERVPVEGSEKELVLVNLHLEAFDDGAAKVAQTEQLRLLLKEEFEKGNYVIAGGDFNQRFSICDDSAYPVINDEVWMPGEINTETFDDTFTFVTDSSVPTCRSLDRPLAGNDASYDKFQYYVIDGYIISDNVSVDEIRTVNQGFRNADHNPVYMRFTLK